MPREMGIAGSRLDLTVAEEFPDHRQALIEGESPGREGMTQVMNSYILESGLLANDQPRRV